MVEHGGFPSQTKRAWLSIWILIHLFALAVSYTSVVEPSSLHARLSQLLQPYLRPTHFGADDRPVYLVHGQPTEQPHLLEITTSSSPIDEIEDSQWKPLNDGDGALASRGGLAPSDRIARWLSTAALLAENEQPSLVAELIVPVVRQDEMITAIRIRRLPTDLNDIYTRPEAIYRARVVRRDGVVALVQLKPPRLSASVLGRDDELSPTEQPVESQVESADE